ncbi:MAG TPA: Holliday junction resolvase RuvX [Firmicutes bacterium]|nr:Holliday junction resolvase RuvX [Bacillota bacterium]
MRVMAIDYGDARTGVAISDGAGLLAGFTVVLPSREEAGLLDELERLIRERGVDELVLGLPRNMDGTEGPRGAVSRAFGAKLAARTGLEVRLWDERRTTIEAHQILHATGKRMRKHKKTVDAVAATLILEGYLARKRLGR